MKKEKGLRRDSYSPGCIAYLTVRGNSMSSRRGRRGAGGRVGPPREPGGPPLAGAVNRSDERT